MAYTKEQLVELVIKALPYPQDINDWDLSQPQHVLFTWRGSRMKVDYTGLVYVQGTGESHGDNLSVVIHRLITDRHSASLSKRKEALGLTAIPIIESDPSHKGVANIKPSGFNCLCCKWVLYPAYTPERLSTRTIKWYSGLVCPQCGSKYQVAVDSDGDLWRVYREP